MSRIKSTLSCHVGLKTSYETRWLADSLCVTRSDLISTVASARCAGGNEHTRKPFNGLLSAVQNENRSKRFTGSLADMITGLKPRC